MPNHVTNKLYVEGADILDVLAIVSSDDKEFDFEKIIPMPEDVRNTVSGSNLGLNETITQAQNVKKYGHGNWYDWANAKWGTKWNAYDIDVEGDCIKFETAWSTPAPIFEALSRLMPDATIIVKFADEDIGSNCGVLVYQNGVEEFMDMSRQGEVSEKFAKEIVYGDANYSWEED